MPETDILVTAVVGMIGIRPTMEESKLGRTSPWQIKKTLVTAGHLIIPMAKKNMVCRFSQWTVRHSAIFQALHGEERKAGGEASYPQHLAVRLEAGEREDLKHITLADTLKASKLGNGAEDNRRFCNAGKQKDWK